MTASRQVKKGDLRVKGQGDETVPLKPVWPAIIHNKCKIDVNTVDVHNPGGADPALAVEAPALHDRGSSPTPATNAAWRR